MRIRAVVVKQHRPVGIRVQPAVFHGPPVPGPLDPDLIIPFFLEDFKIILHKAHDHLFGLHLGELEITVAVALGEQPLLEEFRDVIEKVVIPGVPDGKRVFLPGEPGQSPQVIEFFLKGGEIRMKIRIMGAVVVRDNGVEFNDKDLDFIDKLKYSLGDDDHPVVLAHRGPAHDSVADHPGDVAQGHPIGGVINGALFFGPLQPFGIHKFGQLLTDHQDVGVYLKAYFQPQVAGGAAHDLADVPVFGI